MKAVLAAVSLSLALVACGGGGSQADNAADQLEKAADQSNPAAAQVLDNAANQIRDQNVADANAAVQQSLQEAGNVQAAGAGGAMQRQPVPPPVGAKPHRAGDPVPPPKLPAGQGQSGGAQPNGAGGTGG